MSGQVWPRQAAVFVNTRERCRESRGQNAALTEDGRQTFSAKRGLPQPPCLCVSASLREPKTSDPRNIRPFDCRFPKSGLSAHDITNHTQSAKSASKRETGERGGARGDGLSVIINCCPQRKERHFSLHLEGKCIVG
jgi:hypothetical protein